MNSAVARLRLWDKVILHGSYGAARETFCAMLDARIAVGSLLILKRVLAHVMSYKGRQRLGARKNQYAG